MAKRLLRFLLMLLLSLSIAGCRTPTPIPVPTPGTSTPPPIGPDPFTQNRRLGRGVNLGNALEAPREGEWGVTLEEAYFALIQEAGFTAVRIPIRWSAHATSQAPYTIEPAFFARVDWAIEQALSHGLMTVINMHHYEELAQDPTGQRTRFLALWQQIAEHYRDYPAELLFEPLNEPNGALDAAAWNALLADVLGVIRTSNPGRTLIVDAAQWASINTLGKLTLPESDRNLIVSVHYYQPFPFTHQGAEWVAGSNAWLGTRWTGSAAQRRAVTRDLEHAAVWGKQHQRPLFLGEFGAYSKAELASRVRWTAWVARQAEAQGMSWAYWEFCAGFGVYDQAHRDWNSALREALIPPP